jgi:predicted molibdopterin-dependent oxidoreductase YjgC
VNPLPQVEILVDGRTVRAIDGQSVAGALHQAGIDVLRRNPATGEQRGAFCGMGVCFECELSIDGAAGQRACLAHVQAGMRIETEGEHAATPR